MAERQFVVQFPLPNRAPHHDDLKTLRKRGKRLDRAAFRAGRGRVVSFSAAHGQMNIIMIFPSWGEGRHFFSSYLNQQDWSAKAVVAECPGRDTFKICWPEDHPRPFALSAQCFDPFQKKPGRRSGEEEIQSASPSHEPRSEKKKLRRRFEHEQLRRDAIHAQKEPGVVNLSRLHLRTEHPHFLTRFKLGNPHWLIEVQSRRLHVADPFSLAQVASSSGQTAVFLRRNCVITDHVRSPVQVPILNWKGHIVIPTSAHLETPLRSIGSGVLVLSERVVSHSGSFVFISDSRVLPDYLRRKLDTARQQGTACTVEIQNGAYELCYEVYESYRHQFSPRAREFHNLVLRKLNAA